MDKWEGSQLNKAKEILAYELTALVHGKEEAEKAQEAASCLLYTSGEGLSAEAVEERLERKKFSPSELEFWQKCFEQDNHTLWKLSLIHI